MSQAFVAIFIICIVVFLLVGCVGFYYLCDSAAAERAVGEIAHGVAGAVEAVGQGLLGVLIGGAVAAFLWGLGNCLKQGAEAAGKAVMLIHAAPKFAARIEQGQTARLPGGFTIERADAIPYQLESQLQMPALEGRSGQDAEGKGEEVSEPRERYNKLDPGGAGSHQPVTVWE